MRKRMKLHKMLPQRRLTQIQTKRSKIPNKRRRAFLIRGKRLFFVHVNFGFCLIWLCSHIFFCCHSLAKMACLCLLLAVHLLSVFSCLSFNCLGLLNWICPKYLLQLQRRMKIAELKQICSRPDVVEVCLESSCAFVWLLFFFFFLFLYL